MNNMLDNCNKLKILQHIGEDAAFTFKGLYKTADWYSIITFLLILVSLLFSIFVLGFSAYLTNTKYGLCIIQLISSIALFSNCALLLYQPKLKKVSGYRQLGDEFKNLYDEVRNSYFNNDVASIRIYQDRLNELRKKTHEYPISYIGRKLANEKKVKKEVGIDWIYEECGTSQFKQQSKEAE